MDVVLEQKTDFSGPCGRIEFRQVVTTDTYGSLGEGECAADATKQGALATAVRAENGETSPD